MSLKEQISSGNFIYVSKLLIESSTLVALEDYITRFNWTYICCESFYLLIGSRDQSKENERQI